jgi:hypothetical protein
MFEKPRDPKDYFRLRRFSQITDSHCGPAVIQMLLSNLDIDASQDEIARAAGVTDVIEMQGTRVDQLAQAVRTLAPELRFWYKDHATLDDLAALVGEHGYPVGVEWQGVFDPEPDYGHYSVVTAIDMEKRLLVMVDPYHDYVLTDRVFALDEFDRRWWDDNSVPDDTGEEHLVRDDHMLFVVTTSLAEFPAELGMIKG